MESNPRRRVPMIALTLGIVGLGTSLSGCTEASMDFGPDGPVPSVGIGSLGSGSMSASVPSRQFAAAPPPAASSTMGYPQPAMSQQQQPMNQQTYPPVQQQPVSSAPIAPIQQQAAPAPQSAQPVAAAPTTLAAAPAPAGPAPASVSANQSVGEVQFLPLVGAPEEKAVLLARALSESAAAKGVTIRPAAEAPSSVRLKGYFSAFNDGSSTTLVYVWDVLDESDRRVRRIQGQESVPGAAADPWAAIDLSTLAAVADRTLQEAAQVATGTG
ncbi:hypothetical protein H9Q09_07250 [Aurantimonas sp. DM33-3]|uniref:hypothetical protein n=1 Tax=Aurantimonas sp. DM33-3 TaxID=2766955 RepID=UPI001651B27F|nr:hypothetical protein [Aurantimonas sp. DM33-3]MBC6715991.1 hypothetical protein [Aurantimonas sp. DM33-3]